MSSEKGLSTTDDGKYTPDNIENVEYQDGARRFSLSKDTSALGRRRTSTGISVEDIDNPLRHLSHDQVIAEADKFVDQWNLQDHRDIFRKGALVAQRPSGFEGISALNDEDRAALDLERRKKWHLPGMLLYSVIICALGACVQGWDQTGSNGANLSFPQEFGIGADYDDPSGKGKRDEWIVGLVNSSVYIAGAFLGPWISDPLNHWFGRRGEIFITGVILIITPIASGLTQTWQQLMVVRLIMGVGAGAKAATVPMFCAELSPARIRGALTMGWQLWTAFGIFLGFCANAAVKDVPRIAWRLQLGSAFIPAVPLTLGVFFCPESPRWYMKKGRMTKAWTAMKRLRHTELQAARDLFYAHYTYAEEQKIVQGLTYVSRFTELFTIPRCRRATLAAAVVMIGQQMCGINSEYNAVFVAEPQVMAFYSSTIFKKGGSTDAQALYASIGFGALNFVFALPAVFTIDSFGRRSLLLCTFPNMCWTLLAAGLCFLVDPGVENSTTRTGLVAFFIYLFTIAYSIGEGPVPFMYSAEVFPLAQREQGMAFAVSWNQFWAAVLALTFPRLIGALGETGAFGFYAGLNAVAFIWIFLWVPETKQLTLEELDQVFGVPTKTYTTYQTKTWLPWFFKRYVFRKKDAYLAPLVHEKPLVQRIRDEEASL